MTKPYAEIELSRDTYLGQFKGGFHVEVSDPDGDMRPLKVPEAVVHGWIRDHGGLVAVYENSDEFPTHQSLTITGISYINEEV